MNIIFLDVDGVLNTIKKDNGGKRPYTGYDYPFNEECVSKLAKLVEMTNSYLVIISTWRIHEMGKLILLNELRKHNLSNRIIGYTDAIYKFKEKAILAYLSGLNDVVNYIILDDEQVFPILNDHLIKIDFEYGITDEDINTSVKKISK